MTGLDRSDGHSEQGRSPAASVPMAIGDGELRSPPLAHPSTSPASRSAQTSESSSSVGRTVLGLDAQGLFIEQHTVSSRISSTFQSRADPSGYDWHHVSAATREYYFSEFQKKFSWDPASHDAIRAAWDALAARRYSDMLYRWRRSGERPVHVPEGIWHEWQRVWTSDAWIRRSVSASTNRRSEKGGPGTGLSRHTAGSISIEEHRRRLAQKEGGDPSEYRLFRTTHTRKDGSWVDTRSREVAARVEELQSQASQVDSSDGASPVELSPEESRRVFLEAVGAQPGDRRVYGMGTKASRFFPHQASSSHGPADISSDHLQEIRRSIADEVRQDVRQELRQELREEVREELAGMTERMRQMEDLVRQLSQPPQPDRDPPED